MDQTVSLSQPTPPAATPAALSALPAAPSQAAAAEEEPESPGRSPRLNIPQGISADPLAEGVALLLGVALALTAVLVPLATVLCDADRSPASETVRAGW